ncbi:MULTISPECIES: rubrerythrin-like domain-containing protein [Halorussus]|nr:MULTISPECIES: rubrerythrin-like domain-containing protein [Halorussus]NHN58602.1 rubrerythrin-like domain-containing protein [Halorussus sp. JP-T4]
MVQHTPDTGVPTKQYECRECLTRVTADEHRSTCPECQGQLRNVAVPRE